jgi:carbonic anhydrase
MNRLIPVERVSDILPPYKDTSIGRLLEYHNLARPHDSLQQPELLIGVCVEQPHRLRIPEAFAIVIQSERGMISGNAFEVSYAIALGGIRCIALIGHNNCGMVNFSARKEEFVQGLVNRAGWECHLAEEYFYHNAEMCETGDEMDVLLNEAKRLRLRYPMMQVAPLIYRMEDGLLYQIDESDSAGSNPVIDNRKE